MDLRDKITDDEKSMIEYYIDNYAVEDAPRTASIDYILREWASRKRSLYNVLENNLIISKKIKIEKDKNMLTDQMYYDVTCSLGKGHEFINAFRHWCFDNFEGEKFSQIRHLADDKTLATNKYVDRTFEINLPNGKKFKVQNGCRPLRALAKIADAFNLPGFEDFRLAHSMVLNQKETHGNLCLSIHPLDFITMSENGSDWTSCMNWSNRGCYRQGTIEMMNSGTVVVAYLTAAEDMPVVKDLSWNNKKWRQLFIVDDDMIGNIKAYPYRSDNLTKICLDWLKELAETTGEYGTFTKDIIKYNHGEKFKVPELNNRELYIETETQNMYNDFGDNHFAYIGMEIPSRATCIYESYSGPSECMVCGELDIWLDNEEMLVCESCEGGKFCDCCGTRFAYDTEFIQVGDYNYCPDCAADNCFVDVITQNVELNDSAVSLYISPDNGKTLIDTYLPIAEGSFNMWDMRPFFRSLYSVKHYSLHHFVQTYYYIVPEGVTYDGFKLLRNECASRVQSIGEYMEEITTEAWIEKIDCSDEEMNEFYRIFNWDKEND